MIYGFDIQTPIKYILLYILGIILLSITIRIIFSNIMEVYYEQKQKFLFKESKSQLTTKENENAKN